MGAFYVPTFRKQLDGSGMGGLNCGAASGAMVVDQGSLGYRKPTASEFRRRTGDSSGGLLISTVGNTIEKYGVGVTIFDGSDRLTWSELLAFLKIGRFAVVNGDYSVVPTRLTGSDAFNGLHAVMYHEYSPTKGVRVGDPLNDGRRLPSGRNAPRGYVWYPVAVAKNYVESFDRRVPGASLHAAVLDRKRLKARPVSPATNVRSGPSRTFPTIGQFGGSTTVIWGVKVQGESIAGNATWYRIWLPSANSIGYCHSSVVTAV